MKDLRTYLPCGFLYNFIGNVDGKTHLMGRYPTKGIKVVCFCENNGILEISQILNSKKLSVVPEYVVVRVKFKGSDEEYVVNKSHMISVICPTDISVQTYTPISAIAVKFKKDGNGNKTATINSICTDKGGD